MIDKKYIIRVLGRMICFMAVLTLATACTGDELLDSSANGTEQEGLSISLTLDGMQLASRSASEQSLNEDAVKRMDVFYSARMSLSRNMLLRVMAPLQWKR